jgi:glutaredoxin
MLKIEVITAPGCGKCGRTKELLSRVIKDYDGVELEEVSVVDIAERIVELGIIMTPAIIMNGTLEYRAHPKEEDLRRKIEEYLR